MYFHEKGISVTQKVFQGISNWNTFVSMSGRAKKKASYKTTSIANNLYLSILSDSDVSIYIDGHYTERKWKFEYKSNGKRTTIKQQPNLNGKEYFQY